MSTSRSPRILTLVLILITVILIQVWPSRAQDKVSSERTYLIKTDFANGFGGWSFKSNIKSVYTSINITDGTPPPCLRVDIKQSGNVRNPGRLYMSNIIAIPYLGRDVPVILFFEVKRFNYIPSIKIIIRSGEDGASYSISGGVGQYSAPNKAEWENYAIDLRQLTLPNEWDVAGRVLNITFIIRGYEYGPICTALLDTIEVYIPYPREYVYDSIKPTLDVSFSGEYTINGSYIYTDENFISVNWTASDDQLIWRVFLSIGGGLIDVTNETSYTVPVERNATVELRIFAEDLAGNRDEKAFYIVGSAPQPEVSTSAPPLPPTGSGAQQGGMNQSVGQSSESLEENRSAGTYTPPNLSWLSRGGPLEVISYIAYGFIESPQMLILLIIATTSVIYTAVSIRRVRRSIQTMPIYQPVEGAVRTAEPSLAEKRVGEVIDMDVLEARFETIDRQFAGHYGAIKKLSERVKKLEKAVEEMKREKKAEASESKTAEKKSSRKRSGVRVRLVVVDVSDKSPLSDAVVYVDGSEAGTTDKAGIVRLRLQKGVHKITVRREGYMDMSADLNVSKSMSWKLELYRDMTSKYGFDESVTMQAIDALEMALQSLERRDYNLTIKLLDEAFTVFVTELWVRSFPELRKGEVKLPDKLRMLKTKGIEVPMEEKIRAVRRLRNAARHENVRRTLRAVKTAFENILSFMRFWIPQDKVDKWEDRFRKLYENLEEETKEGPGKKS